MLQAIIASFAHFSQILLPQPRSKCSRSCEHSWLRFGENSEITSSHIWSKHNSRLLEPLYDLRTLFEQAEANTLVRERGEPVFLEDILSSTILPAALFEQMGIHSLALLPLVTARGVIGFIAVFKPTPYSFLDG